MTQHKGNYVVIMSYLDRSGIIGVFGPFADKTQASHMAETVLPGTPWIMDGLFEVAALYALVDEFGFPSATPE